ncbi:MAG: amidohydrolase [Acidobacteriia bacterium]|nr:amidohydrolase [Terriglobia bacterium]
MKSTAIILSCLLVVIAAGAQANRSTSPSVSAEQVAAIYPGIESLYIDLHKSPELAFQEKQTAAKLAERVKALGYEVTTGVGGTGIVAVMKNGPGPTVMMRTELDALPVLEKTGLPFASTVTTKNAAGETVPVMHACGHDLHMSAWYGTAELMAKNKQKWHGTLMMIGQPAEEVLQGAAAMLKDGLFTRFPKPDYALSLHDEATLPAGTIGYHPGFFRASADTVEVTIFGRGGHGAAPHDTVDPIVIASRFVLGLQTIVSRENNPMDPAVITVGSIHGGTQANIIPDQVKLQLTVRTFNPAARKRMLAAIEREAKGEAMAANAPKEPVVEIKAGTDAEFNDPKVTERMVATLRKALGPDKVVEMPAKMTSEDFSQYGLAGVPAILLHIGAVDPAKLAESKQSGKPLPAPHSPQWAPVFQPTVEAAIRAETAVLMDLLGG